MLGHDHFLKRIAASGVYVAMKYLLVFDEQSRFVSVLCDLKSVMCSN